MSKLSRREMIRMVATPLPLLTVLPVLTVCGRPDGAYDQLSQPARTLAAYLDILFPADGMPSASELGIHFTILAEGRFESLILMGCEWLDKMAQKQGAADYANLDVNARIRMVEYFEASQPSSLPREFFVLSLELAYEHYYSREAAWSGLGFRGPPQPRGYMDYDQPPVRVTS